jgi:hypothetical protein
MRSGWPAVVARPDQKRIRVSTHIIHRRRPSSMPCSTLSTAVCAPGSVAKHTPFSV